MEAITVSAAAAAAAAETEEALERLISTEPHLYLSPSPELSGAARLTCSHLFSSLLPLCPKPPPFDRLLAGKDFDAEQIWGQIDEMSRPLVSMLRRELKRLEREPPAPHATVPAEVEDGKSEENVEEDEVEDEEAAADEDRDEEDEDDEDEDEGDEEEVDAGNAENGGGVEDRFLKIKELEEYLLGAEAKEYGHSEPGKRRENGEDDGDEDEEDDDLEFGGFDSDDNQETDVGESARYDDFFGSKKQKGGDKTDIGIKKAGSSKKVKFADELEDFEMDDEQDDDEEEEEEQEDDEDTEAQDAVLSTHEKELKKLHSRIEQMEKANMEPKSWTMQGEITAAKRPKNSALEVDLDFEHNTRPAPVITEEVTASIEDLIKKRINEDHFDDVQKAPVLPSKAPKELIELDENKSKKGLAEIYEEEYAHKAGLVAIPLSSSDEQKKEATILFKNLCVKLDALSHFHFAPKPIIEDMSIQTNVPALAMEEIAPLAVSDASMLAPEEIFEGKGDIKEEAELTQEERKRRRANKKRKHKAGEAKRSAKKVRVHTDPGHLNGSEI